MFRCLFLMLYIGMVAVGIPWVLSGPLPVLPYDGICWVVLQLGVGCMAKCHGAWQISRQFCLFVWELPNA